jgi:patatin-like phospholipase/acyl hydrolase
MFEAALLAALERDLEIDLVDYFDLIVGTSTGGILALGLGAGIRPGEILEFYLSHQRRIFANPAGWRSAARPWRAKYPAGRLEAPLREVFGERLLGESRVPLVVPAYNVGVNDIYLFKTPHHERLRRDHRVAMWQVAMATAAAPTFFPAFRLQEGRDRLVDGGLWANNPALVGVAEAVSMFGSSLSQIRVLSVGTLAGAGARPARLDRGGLLAWMRSPHLVSVLLRAQGAGVLGQVQHLIGPQNLYRLDATVPDELLALDRCDPDQLIGRASHESRIFAPTFQQAFRGHAPSPYTPIHGPNAKQVTHAHP